MSHLTFRCLTTALVVGLPAASWSTSAQAIERGVFSAVHVTDAGTVDSAVRTVSYTTGEAGHKLKWLPYRPSKDDAKRGRPPQETSKRAERLVQYTSPLASKPAKRDALDPFDDPFEDSKGGSEPIGSSAPLQDNVLESGSPPPLLPGSLPDIAGDDPRLGAESLEAPAGLPGLLREEPLVVAPTIPEDPCSSIRMTPISEITHDISARGDMFPAECPLAEGLPPDAVTRGWSPITFTWKASALCHKPAYFEQVHLERYGHSCGPYLQPVVSGAHFFLTVPILPYKMGLYPPNECIYTLGYYRPGSCAPYMLDPLPISIRAGLFQAAAWTGMPYLIP